MVEPRGMGDEWPLFELRMVAADGLELRYPGDDELAALAQLARQGVHDPATTPFVSGWTDHPPDVRAVGAIRYGWRSRVDWSPQKWDAGFAVVVDGTVVGSQAIAATDFAVTREVGTGSWLGQQFHGRGIGTRMRAAALSFAFDHLGAESAVSGAFVDNPASNAVSRKVGYIEDGLSVFPRRGERAVEQRYRLTREAWVAQARTPVTVTGFDRVRGWFDAHHPGWPA